MQNIIEQKEEIIVRLQNKLKETGDEHTQNVYKLVKEIKILQNSVSLKEQAYDRFENALNFELQSKLGANVAGHSIFYSP